METERDQFFISNIIRANEIGNGYGTYMFDVRLQIVTILGDFAKKGFIKTVSDTSKIECEH